MTIRAAAAKPAHTSSPAGRPATSAFGGCAMVVRRGRRKRADHRGDDTEADSVAQLGGGVEQTRREAAAVLAGSGARGNGERNVCEHEPRLTDHHPAENVVNAFGAESLVIRPNPSMTSSSPAAAVGRGPIRVTSRPAAAAATTEVRVMGRNSRPARSLPWPRTSWK